MGRVEVRNAVTVDRERVRAESTSGGLRRIPLFSYKNGRQREMGEKKKQIETSHGAPTPLLRVYNLSLSIFARIFVPSRVQRERKEKTKNLTLLGRRKKVYVNVTRTTNKKLHESIDF